MATQGMVKCDMWHVTCDIDNDTEQREAEESRRQGLSKAASQITNKILEQKGME